MMHPLKKRIQKKGGERFFWADFIRVTAIFLVVYIHQLYLLPELSVGTMWIWIPNLFSQAAMPLFVMISGAFLLGKDEPTSYFFEKRVRRVVIPWIFWVVVYLLLDHFVKGISPGGVKEWIRLGFVEFMSRFWFLPMIFGLYLLTPIFRKMIVALDRKRIIYAIALWFFTFSLFPALLEISGSRGALDASLLRQIFQYSGFYFLGYMLVIKKYWQKPPRFWVTLFMVSLFGTYAAVFLSSLKGNEIQSFFYGIYSVTMVPGIVALFMCLFFFAKRIEKSLHPFFFSLVALGAKVSLGIYLSHQIVQDVFFVKLPSIEIGIRHLSPLVAIPVKASIIFLLTFCLMVIFKKLPLLREVV